MREMTIHKIAVKLDVPMQYTENPKVKFLILNCYTNDLETNKPSRIN